MINSNISLETFLNKITADFCIIKWIKEEEFISKVFILTDEFTIDCKDIEDKTIKNIKPIYILQPSEISNAFNLNVGDSGFIVEIE
ncbi:MAG: hypothetical protein II625_02435 [Bacilli bacterium]|nr:hypothetical protein [Bacilli bacterium]